MKRTVFLLSLLLGISPSLRAQEIDGVSVGNLKMDRNGEYLSVKMDIGLSKLDGRKQSRRAAERPGS